MEEADVLGLSGGFEQGKPETALPELTRHHTTSVFTGQTEFLKIKTGTAKKNSERRRQLRGMRRSAEIGPLAKPSKH